jgi:hypothetical protein
MSDIIQTTCLANAIGMSASLPHVIGVCQAPSQTYLLMSLSCRLPPFSSSSALSTSISVSLSLPSPRGSGSTDVVCTQQTHRIGNELHVTEPQATNNHTTVSDLHLLILSLRSSSFLACLSMDGFELPQEKRLCRLRPILAVAAAGPALPPLSAICRGTTSTRAFSSLVIVVGPMGTGSGAWGRGRPGRSLRTV